MENKKEFGQLIIIKEEENGNTCFCQCKCGEYIFVPKEYLAAGVIKNCGCSKSRAINLTGQRFGSLTVLKPVQKRDADHSIRWLCRCDCGEYTTVSSNKLRTGHTKSCGCQKLTKAKEAKTFVDGTCVEILFSEKIRTNNTSGHTGVSKKGKKWQAYLTYGKKTFWLGTYRSKEEAIQAREDAERWVKTHLTSLTKAQGAHTISEQEPQDA